MGVGKTELGRVALEKRAVPGVSAKASENPWRRDAERAGIRIADPRTIVIELCLLDLIPREIATSHGVLPMRADGGKLAVLMARPTEDAVCTELSFVTGLEIVPFAAEPGQVEVAIRCAYDAHRKGERFYEGPDAPVGARSVSEGRQPPAFDDVPATGPQNAKAPGLGRLELVGLDAAPMSSAGPEIPDLVQAADGVAETAKEALAVAPAKGTVLIVAPTGAGREVSARTLGDRSWNAVTAADAREVKEALNERPISCIVLDPELSGIHGFELLTRLRGSRRFEALPVVVRSTGMRDWRLAKDLRQTFGVQYCLFDPFDQDELGFAVDCSDERFRDAAIAKSRQKLEQGIAAMKSGAGRAGLKHFEAGLAINPFHAELHLHFGLAERKRRGIFCALQSLQRAHYYEPDNFVAAKNLAMLYQTVRFTSKAEEIAECALSSAPSDEQRQSIKNLLSGWTKPNP